jgi:G3E family GTPase
MPEQIKKIPAFIISGFLGSGKTTVLLRLLKELKSKGKSVGVVLNELGEVNVEKDLFAGEKLIEMLNGCICCTIQTDLQEELLQFINAEQNIDVILIEGTGVANPTEIIEALTHPNIIDRVEIQSVITLIDASRFLEYQSIFSSSKEIRKVLKEQLGSCSLLVVNKVDLVDQQKLKKVQSKISENIKMGVEIVETTFGEVDLDTLLKPRMKTVHVEAKSSCSCENCGCHKKEEEEHHHHEHNHGFQALKIDNVPTLDRISLEKWLQKLPDHVIRAKGIIQFTESPRKFQFQYASGQLRLEKVNDPTEKTCLIIIGYGMDIDLTRQTFEQSVLV